MNQSLSKILFDNSSDSIILSNAVFDIAFSKSNITLLNGPEDDITITEIGSPEAFKLTVFDKGEPKSLTFTPTYSGEINNCDQDINVASIDLGAFGIANGSSIQTIRVDNLGKQGCCFGADIAGIGFIAEK